MNVRFNVKDTGLVQMKFRCFPGQLPFVWSTRQHVKKKDWNKRTMRAIVRNQRLDVHLVDLNRLLNRMESEALSFYRQHTGTDGLTKPALKAHLNNKFFPTTKNEVTLITFIRDELMLLDRSKETIQNYRHTSNVLERFTTEERLPVSFDAIDFEWLARFKKFCYRKDYSISTVGKFISIIKFAVNTARKQGHTENKIVTERGFSEKKTKRTRVKLALYEHEVLQLERFDWSTVEKFESFTGEVFTRQRLVKGCDIMLAGIYTGLRHSDFDKISKGNIKEFKSIKLIDVFCQKTKDFVAIPLSTRLEAILEKYNYRLPVVSRSEVLRTGRAVLECAGIHREVKVVETRGRKITPVSYPVFQKFSAHLTRRTFARTNYLKDETLLTAINAILGHTTIERTLEYIDIEGMLTAERFVQKSNNTSQLKAIGE